MKAWMEKTIELEEKILYGEQGESQEKEVANVKIRVTFNRPLTYSERESFRRFYTEDVAGFGKGSGYVVKFTDSNRVYIEDHMDNDSRVLFDSLAVYVEKNFVNLHPVAVKTFKPEVKV